MSGPITPSLPQRITFAAVTSGDFEELVSLRTAAMRESLERVGRFDPERARERLKNSFYPDSTRFVLFDNQKVGFYTFRPLDGSLRLEHLYVHPSQQSQGIGSCVLNILFAVADDQKLSVKVGALKESASNRFYLRYGFVKQSEDAWDIYYMRPAISDAAAASV